MDEDVWFKDETKSRAGWRAVCREGMESSAEKLAAQASAAVGREVVCGCNGTCHQTQQLQPHQPMEPLHPSRLHSLSLSAPLRLYIPPVPQNGYCPVIPK